MQSEVEQIVLQVLTREPRGPCEPVSPGAPGMP